ncbi:MAG: rRNA maturation RNase YbeY [Phycisphaeraceae bacterium]|nr:rRNA maturation RNase YbeY [Phycisphaeraceae bacterium]
MARSTPSSQVAAVALADESGEADRPPAAGAPGGVVVDVIDATGRMDREDAAWLGQWAGRAVLAAGGEGEVRARVVGDPEMAEAHRRYSGVEGTTDVLTFDLRPDPSAGGALDTDVLICLDEAVRQAATRGHPVRRELLLYILHGVLHCLGHDDHSDEGYRAMHAREDEILRTLGVGETFGEAGSP